MNAGLVFVVGAWFVHHQFCVSVSPCFGFSSLLRAFWLFLLAALLVIKLGDGHARAGLRAFADMAAGM
jgi:hypothetical protein